MKSFSSIKSRRASVLSMKHILWAVIVSLIMGTIVIHYQMNHILPFSSSSSYVGGGSNDQPLLLPARVSRPNLRWNNQQQRRRIFYNPKNKQKEFPRTLIGIISSDSFNDCAYRKRHRDLFQIWNDPRVCSIANITNNCQIIYTFILGAGNVTTAPTQRVSSSSKQPLLVPKPIPTRHEDVNYPDTTLLNIRENMNEGKSESFLYFASTVMKEHPSIQYAMKLDADAILHLHDYLQFAHDHLPPQAMGRIFVGALRNKYHWPIDTNEAPMIHEQKEEYWKREFDGVHLYLAGQCYIVGQDLIEWIIQEAPNNIPYMEHHEDHDVSAMAQKSPLPITIISISKTQRFWEHPVKGQPRWDRIVKRETARMKRQVFEGKTLRIY